MCHCSEKNTKLNFWLGSAGTAGAFIPDQYSILFYSCFYPQFTADAILDWKRKRAQTDELNRHNKQGKMEENGVNHVSLYFKIYRRIFPCSKRPALLFPGSTIANFHVDAMCFRDQPKETAVRILMHQSFVNPVPPPHTHTPAGDSGANVRDNVL